MKLQIQQQNQPTKTATTTTKTTNKETNKKQNVIIGKTEKCFKQEQHETFIKEGGFNKNEIQLNLRNKLSILMFNELYLFA